MRPAQGLGRAKQAHGRLARSARVPPGGLRQPATPARLRQAIASASPLSKALTASGVVAAGIALAVVFDSYLVHEAAYGAGVVLAAAFYIQAAGSAERRLVWLNLALLALMLLLNYLYGVSNRPIGTVHSVEAGFDADVPIAPAFAVPYLGLYAFIPFAIALVGAQARHRELATLLGALSLSMLVALATFVVFQTFVPPPDPADWGGEPFRSMIAYIENELYAGNYYSAFPSEHCGYATILAIAVWRVAGRGVALVAAVFGVAVVLSTQLLNQHVVLDAIYGVVLAVAAYAVAWTVLEHRDSGRVELTRT